MAKVEKINLEGEGWKLYAIKDDYVIATRRHDRTSVHWLIFLFTFWFSFGILNFLYYFAKREKLHIARHLIEEEEK